MRLKPPSTPALNIVPAQFGEHSPAENESHRKHLWVAAGWVCLALAIVGVFLPIVPQIPFAIAAAYCFSKGSPKLHQWILNHKTMGPPVRDWEEHRVVRPKLKAISTVMLLAGGGMAFYKFYEDKLGLAIGLAVVFVAAIVFVVTRKSRPDPVRRR